MVDSSYVQSYVQLQNSHNRTFYEVIETQFHQVAILFDRMREVPQSVELCQVIKSVENIEDILQVAHQRMHLGKDALISPPGSLHPISMEKWITGNMGKGTPIKTWNSFCKLVSDLEEAKDDLTHLSNPEILKKYLDKNQKALSVKEAEEAKEIESLGIQASCRIS